MDGNYIKRAATLNGGYNAAEGGYKPAVNKKKVEVNEMKELKLWEGTTESFYTGKFDKGGDTINITYDCNTNNLIIHEWYLFSKSELAELTTKLLDLFKRVQAA